MDAFIVAMSLVPLLLPSQNTGVVRILRALRILRLFRRVPSLRKVPRPAPPRPAPPRPAPCPPSQRRPTRRGPEVLEPGLLCFIRAPRQTATCQARP